VNGWFPSGAEPRPGSFTVRSVTDLVSVAEVKKLLHETDGTGWICTTDRVRRVPSTDLGDAAPLSAEIVLKGTPGQSLHIRQHGTGWRAWLLEDRLEDGPDLAVDESFLSTEGGARLRYRTWWRLQAEGPVDFGADVQVWRPFAARFLGWEDS